MTTQDTDGWNAGDTYDDFMGRWSRPLAGAFIEWVGLPEGGHWLDVGTGTGALAAAICRLARPASVVACDPSAPFVEAAQKALSDPRVTVVQGGTGSLPARAGGYDAVVSGLALNFFPDAGAAVREQMSAVRPGGAVGAFVWDYAEGMEFLRHFWDAATAVEPAAAAQDEGRRFPVCEPGALASLLSAAGAEQVRTTSLSVPTVFRDFEDYWRPFLGGTGPAPAFVASLSEERRNALVSHLEARLPVSDGGAIELQARAWAVVGHRP